MTKNSLISSLALGAALTAGAACGGDDGGEMHTSTSNPRKDAATDAPGNRDAGMSTGGGNLDGGTGTMTNPAVGALCTKWCGAIAAAKCAGDNPVGCADDCVDSVAHLPRPCQASFIDLLDCTSKAQFMCDADQEATPVGCDAQLLAVGNCLNDQAGSSDASLPHPTRDGGKLPIPHNDGGTTVIADGGVVDDICAPEADDTSCDTCVKTSCCDVSAACGDDCNMLGSCVFDCDADDDDCTDTCYAEASDDGVAQFNAIFDCSYASCEVECYSTP